MLEITNVKVYELKESVISSRNAMRVTPPEYTEEEFNKSLERAKKLVQTSKNDEHVKCHDNFLIGIKVSFDIKYPQYISPELQRYHFLDIVTSSSKMHKLVNMDLDFSCNKYVSGVQIEEMNKHIALYKKIRDEKISCYAFTFRDGHIETPITYQDCLYTAFMICVSNCPLGLELFMRCSTNYKQLQTIYWQRKNHKLKEDWGAFNKFIEGLPYFKEFILGE